MQNAAVVIQGEELIQRVGDLIRKARKAKGLTQAELGQLAGGKDKETVVRMERGQNTTLLTLSAIAEALGTTADAILAAARSGQTNLWSEVTSPVSPSGIKGANRPRVNTAATDVGGLDGHAEDALTPIPPDKELADRMREHAELLQYTINRFTQHTKLLWSLVAAYDDGALRSDRTPRPPAARGPSSPNRGPAPGSRHSKKASSQ